MIDLSFFKNKKVLITGHTGFKGSWMSTILINSGANLTGYSDRIEDGGLFEILNLESQMNHVSGDVRDLKHLKKVFEETQPEIVIHMAAQPLVRESYNNPVCTYETNVMGTVNILECVRLNSCVKSFLNVTTDKVYENKEKEAGYKEDEPLDGFDPYSNSKSCSELVTHSYKKSFFSKSDVAISSARAGNVIGGGDFAKDRIIPDCIRAAVNKEDIVVRNPFSVRPYQHVLEPVMAYLMIAQKQYEDIRYADWYNVGPDDTDCLETKALVELFIKFWSKELKWIDKYDGGPHEAVFLKLDNGKIKRTFGWKPTWNLEKAMEKTVEWSKGLLAGHDVRKIMNEQIKEFLGE